MNCSRYAIYIAPDGSIGFAWESGVCAITPMEAMFASELISGGVCICHDAKRLHHQLDAQGLPFGKVGFDTFSHYKSIVDKKTWMDLPMRYQPYQKIYDKMIRMFLK
jgi:hypothetical protein